MSDDGRIATSYGSTDNSITPNDNNSMEQPNSKPVGTLNLIEKLGYGLGHVFNDLSAGVWFSYTLLFLQSSIRISSVIAGGLVMIGQVGDAIATPFAGYIADRYWTKRNWHILGIK